MFSADDYLSLSEIRGLFAVGNQPSDDELAFAFAEVERRSDLFGSHYPFAVDRRGVMIDSGTAGYLYFMLLLLSLKGTPLRANRDFPRSDAIFDAVTREAFRVEFGHHAQALNFGWPPRDGRPSDFRKAVAWVASRLGVGLTRDPIPDHYLDAGVDVIVWRPFGDGRNGFRVLLVQNTVQLSFSKKPFEVRPRNWSKWCDFGSEPGVGFAVPFAMPEGDRWWDGVVEAANLVLDRGRIMEALSDVSPTKWKEWPEIERFVVGEINEVRLLGAFSPEATVSVARPRVRKPGGPVVD